MAAERRIGLPRAVSLAAALVVVATSAACASADDGSSRVRLYECESGVSFSARFEGRHVEIVTSGHRYALARRSSSIGKRYGSDGVAFATDEERSVLIGATGGPYRGCVARGSKPTARHTLRPVGHQTTALTSGGASPA